jgi:hypothetical protein
MRFFLSVILIALLSAAVEYFLPWWSIAVVCFLVSLFVRQGSGRAFLMGFCGIGIFWLTAALLHDISNEHILSARMAALFHLPNYALFIVVTAFIGGLVGGLAAWSAALVKPRNVLP